MTQQAGPDQIAVEEWRLRALEKRKLGKTFRQIQKELGEEGGPVSLSRAYELVVEALNDIREQCKESAADIRDIEVQRCDAMIEELFRRLTNTGSPTTNKISHRTAARLVDSILRIQDRKARYLALDAPKRIEATGSGGAPLIPKVTSIAIQLVEPGQPIPTPIPVEPPPEEEPPAAGAPAVPVPTSPAPVAGAAPEA